MTTQQRTPEWFEARKNRVTGSSVGGVLGLSPFMTRSSVMRAMVREALGAPSEFPDPAPPPVAWGTAMEPQALLDYELETMHDVVETGFHAHDDWLGASPDGLLGTKGVLEIKCPYGLRNDPQPIFKSAAEQPHYAAQMQIEMFCTGRQWAHFFQWTPHGHKLEKVDRDDDWLNATLPVLRQFHEQFLSELEQPDEHIEPLRKIIDTPEAAMMVKEYDELKAAIENATERAKELLADMAAMGGGESDRLLISGRKLTRVAKAGSISYGKAIKALLPDADLEPYRGKPSSYWTLS